MARVSAVIAPLLLVTACGGSGMSDATPRERVLETSTTMTAAPVTRPPAASSMTSLPPNSGTTADSEPETGDGVQSGVAGEDPEEFLAEIEELRDSAGPGRIVGFALLQEGARSGFRSWQPYCVGVGEYAAIPPGAEVTVLGDDGTVMPDVAILRGSAIDAHTGCAMWFGLDVADSDSYTISIGIHSATFDATQLEAHDWVVDLWSSARVRDAECEEAIAYGQTCGLSAILEPLN